MINWHLLVSQEFHRGDINNLVLPHHAVPVANKGLGWDSSTETCHIPGGDQCILGGGGDPNNIQNNRQNIMYYG